MQLSFMHLRTSTDTPTQTNNIPLPGGSFQVRIHDCDNSATFTSRFPNTIVATWQHQQVISDVKCIVPAGSIGYCEITVLHGCLFNRV